MSLRSFIALIASTLGAFLLFSAPAVAQVPGSGITFQGPAISGDCPQIVSAYVQRDSGSACGGGGGGVTSFSAGTTGLTPSTATTGIVTLGGVLSTLDGGTGQVSYSDGQLLIGNSATGSISRASITAGANITITPGNGSITIAATGGSGSGCIPAGAATSLLTDSGAGGCTSNPAFTYSSGTATLGTAGSLLGSMAFHNLTSGTLTLAPPTGALGTVTVTIPDATDTLVNLTSAQTLSTKTLASPTFSGTVAGANTVPLTILSQIATNTVLGNSTSGTANVTALTLTSCSTSGSAVIWTTNTGFGCNTAVNAAQLGGATFAAPGPIGSTTPGTVDTTGLTLSSTTSPITLNASVGTSGNCLLSGGTGATPSWGSCGSGGGGLSWQGIKTTAITAAANQSFCPDTTSAAIAALLPTTPADGTQVGFTDCKGQWGVHNFTVNPGGTDTIMPTLLTGLVISTPNIPVTFIYVLANTNWTLAP